MFLLILYMPIVLAALSVLICGSKKKEETQKKKVETIKMSAEDEKKSEENKRIKEKEEELQKLKEVHWIGLKEYLNSCRYLEQFKACDLAQRIQKSYYDFRYISHQRAYWYEEELDIKGWLEYDVAEAEKYLPLFREVVKKKEEHKNHMNRKSIEEIDNVMKAIEKDCEKMFERKRKLDKEGGKGRIVRGYINSFHPFKFDGAEEWMIPFGREHEQEERPQNRNQTNDSEWKERDKFKEVLKTCTRIETDGKCDFIARMNWYVVQNRLYAKGWPEEFMGVYETELVVATIADWIAAEKSIASHYIPEIEEAKKIHGPHHDEPQEIDRWIAKHKEKVKEIENANRKEADVVYGEKNYTTEKWMEFVGDPNMTIHVDLASHH